MTPPMDTGFAFERHPYYGHTPRRAALKLGADRRHVQDRLNTAASRPRRRRRGAAVSALAAHGAASTDDGNIPLSMVAPSKDMIYAVAPGSTGYTPTVNGQEMPLTFSVR
ncbi:MAG: hypothetical protein WCI78_18680 [Mycobacterium sp.]